MKLRLKNNSIRLRLTQSEVARFAEEGFVEEMIEFGTEPAQRFVYALETKLDAENISAAFEDNRITIFVPISQADEWTESAQVGIEGGHPIDEGKTLRLLIEKDFACLEPRAGEDEPDAYPHPGQEKIC